VLRGKRSNTSFLHTSTQFIILSREPLEPEYCRSAQYYNSLCFFVIFTMADTSCAKTCANHFELKANKIFFNMCGKLTYIVLHINMKSCKEEEARPFIADHLPGPPPWCPPKIPMGRSQISPATGQGRRLCRSRDPPHVTRKGRAPPPTALGFA
jgi:hypothetical protein